MMLSLLLFTLLSLVVHVQTSTANLVNVEVSRNIDVSGTVAISETKVLMQNKGAAPAASFFLGVHQSDMPGLGDLWVTDPSVKGHKALRMKRSSDVPGLGECCSGYSVSFAKPVAPGAEITVFIHMDVSNVIKAVPEVIEGHSDQFMRYEGNSYFFTPYETGSMVTVLQLGSSSVTSKNGLVKPFELKGKKLMMGPYKDVKPLSYGEMDVRFMNRRGFLVAKRASKRFYVSHWGKIAIKEEFEVVNGGARHTGEWSRIDHTLGFTSKYPNVIGDVWANLPKDAGNVIYKDLIGNITSSRLRKPYRGQRPIQLTFRYPMVGGWKNHFWVTYDVLLKNYGMSKGARHQLKLPLFPSLNTDLLSEELEVRILLPEGARDIHVRPHASLKFDTERTFERTTLNFIGRPVVTLRRPMLRSESKHDKFVTIEYTYTTALIWVTPVIVGAGIFTLFLACIVLIRTEVALGNNPVFGQSSSGAEINKEKSS